MWTRISISNENTEYKTRIAMTFMSGNTQGGSKLIQSRWINSE
jgi:hypothetical protein